MNQDTATATPAQKPKVAPAQTNGTSANGHTNGHMANGHTTNGHTGEKKLTSQGCIELEKARSARNYHPLPIVFSEAKGAIVHDVENRRYIDCLSAYCAMNQGHCHPRIVAALIEQAQKLTLSSRAFHSDKLGEYAEKITSLLGFDMVLPMNTGAEAVETALKLARKWAYRVKGVPANKAIILSVTDNFHGRTLGIVSMSTDPSATIEFGPFLDTVGPVCPVGNSSERQIRYNNILDLERALEAHGDRVAAFLVEPIQGEAGIIIPDDDYLLKVQELCRKHNVLLICDEVQTGLGRTGKMLAVHHYPDLKPDIVTLGKALSGGVYPVSAVLANKEVMLQIRPGEHGSTYGGNPLGCAVAMAALDVLVDEKLPERAARLGVKFSAGLSSLKTIGATDPSTGKGGWISTVRCRGLFAAIVLDNKKSVKGRGAWDLCLLLASKGVLCKPTHENTIRLAPPLVIEEEDLDKVIMILREALEEFDTIETIPGAEYKNHGQPFAAL